MANQRDGRSGKPPGHPKTGGRKKGQVNRTTLEMRELAHGYAAKVVEGLYKIFTTSESDAARVSAGREILDRAFGRPPQAIAGDPDGGPIVVKHVVTWLK